MCGIVGYIGKRDAAPILIEGLHRLEYRGYDSAGIAVAHAGELRLAKCKGRVRELERLLPSRFKGSPGIAHTRWATHGEPSDRNAHPHCDTANRIAVIHNGIIENAAASPRSDAPAPRCRSRSGRRHRSSRAAPAVQRPSR